MTRLLGCVRTLALLGFGSCSLLVPTTQSVAVTSSEAEAEIYVDGNFVGKGAATVDLRRNKSHTFMAKFDGRTGMASVGNSVSVTGVLDIVGGVLFLVPFVGLAGAGFYSLDSTEILVVLPPPA